LCRLLKLWHGIGKEGDVVFVAEAAVAAIPGELAQDALGFHLAHQQRVGYRKIKVRHIQACL